jgi:general nucleoside transport system permease protein
VRPSFPPLVGIFVILGVLEASLVDLSLGSHTATLNLSGGAAHHLAVTISPTILIVAASCLCFVVAALTARQRTASTLRRLTTVIALGVCVGSFVAWAGAGQTVDVTALLAASVVAAVPITLGSIAGAFSELCGVINIAIEGQFLVGAFGGAIVGSAFGSWAGLGAAALAGGLLGALLAYFAIRYAVNQIVLGVVLNVFALGVTSFLDRRVLLVHQDTLNTPTVFGQIRLPLLSSIPVVGPVLFDANLFVYVTYVLLALSWGVLYRTRVGLRLRSAGEHPLAAETVGLDVIRIRYRSVIFGGLIAGFGGAYFTLGTVGGFTPNASSGQGYIALAALYFGRWNPVRAALAALLFGFTDTAQSLMSILGTTVPSNFLLVTPYLVTIVVLAGAVGRVRGPAAAGRPFVRGEA